MVEAVKALGNIALNKPDRSGPGLVDVAQGGVTSPTWPKSMGAVGELRLVVRLQKEADDFLEQLIRPGGHPERTLLRRVGFLDVDTPDGRPPIAFLAECVNDGTDLHQGHPIYGFPGASRRHGARMAIDSPIGHEIE